MSAVRVLIPAVLLLTLPPGSLSEEEDYFSDDASMDRELRVALRECMAQMEQRGPDQSAANDMQGQHKPSPACQENDQQKPNQNGRRQEETTTRRAGSLHQVHQHAGPRRPFLASPSRTDLMTGTSRGRGPRRARRGSHRDGPAHGVAECAIYCAFARVQLLGQDGLPDEALLTKRLEDSLWQPGLRVQAMREARICYTRLGRGSGYTSALEEDPCLYTQQLADCLGMEIAREYRRVRSNRAG